LQFNVSKTESKLIGIAWLKKKRKENKITILSACIIELSLALTKEGRFFWHWYIPFICTLDITGTAINHPVQELLSGNAPGGRRISYHLTLCLQQKVQSSFTRTGNTNIHNMCGQMKLLMQFHFTINSVSFLSSCGQEFF
jgi:hypothetical protein